MFLVDKLSKKVTIAGAKASFGLLSLLASLLICASLLTPAWRHADADIRLYTPKGIVLTEIGLSTGLFGFACNYAIDQSGENKHPIEGTELCQGWAEVQSPYEKIAAGLVATGLACSLVSFFWNLLASSSKRSSLIKFLPFLALFTSTILCSALILFFINSCRDSRITSIKMPGANFTNTGCSIGYSYSLALMAFLFSLANVLVGTVIVHKTKLPRKRTPTSQRRKSSAANNKSNNVLVKKQGEGKGKK